MRTILTQLCRPILALFEGGEVSPNYKPSHRKILLAVGVLFLLLTAVSLYFGLSAGIAGALLPVLIFGGGGLICLVVGGLGSDAAVSKIWGSR